MPMISLMLAFFWLAIGLGLFALGYYRIETGFAALDEYPAWVTTLALVLCAYNIFRYRYARHQQWLRELEEEPPPPRPRRRDEDRPIDPNFDFSDPTKPPEPRP